MSKNARDNRPYIRPVTRLELSEANIKFRWIAIVVLLAIAVVAIGYGFHAALSTEPGWQEITVHPEEVNCSEDFVLMYDFSVGDINPTAAHKKLEILYSELTVEAYRLFHAEAEGTDNLYHINKNVNSSVKVAPALYTALEKIVKSGNRHVFMGPVRELYDSVFLSATDAEAENFDPMKNPERGELARETASYCASAEMVSLELLGENAVRLNVSQEYLRYAEEYGIETYLDLGWMTNAFIADHIAQALEKEGLTNGYLASFDGFTRNLYGRNAFFSQNIYHCVDNDIYLPASLEYSGPMSIVSLRGYPLSDRDRWHYHAYEDGSITSVYLDPADGTTKASIDGFTAYSKDGGCSEILLKVASVFTAETFDASSLESLTEQGIQSVWCTGNRVVCTETAASVKILDQNYDIADSNAK